MEMLEHVPDPASIIQACHSLVRPGGYVFFSTINRNPKSYLFAIVGAEYVLNMLPKGTHDFAKFIRPSELAHWIRDAGLETGDISGMTYNPFTQIYKLDPQGCGRQLPGSHPPPRVTMPAPSAVLFDLDGTLADTAPDLAYALNQTLQHYGRQALPFEQIRPVVSHGGIALIRLGFQMQTDEAGFEERRQHLLGIYENNLCRDTKLFPGMQQVLDHLTQTGILWGVVTNKPAWLTDPLMDAMQLSTLTPAIVSGDTCSQRKPHPEPIHHACKLLRVSAEDCWYVGDAGRDMQAGRAAGCFNVGALYGYIYPDDPPDLWDTDVRIDRAEQLIDLLRQAATDD